MTSDQRPPDRDPEPDPRLDELLRAAHGGPTPPTPHPSPDVLLAYHTRSLAADEEEEVREHLATCATCARAVLDFEDFADLEPPEDRAPTELDRRRLWRRIEAAERTPAPGASPATVRWLGALAAALLVTVVGLSVWVIRLQPEPSPVRSELALATLVPAGTAGTVRGQAQSVLVPPWAESVVLVLSHGGLERPDRYRIELVDDAGRVAWSEPEARRGEDGTFTVEVERAALPPGEHTVRLVAVDGGSPTTVAEYPVRVEHTAPR